MQRGFAYLVAVFTLLVGLAPSVAQAADAEEQQREAAKQFLTSYLRHDYAGLPAVVATEEKTLFNPYPFKGAVKLGQPKVDDNQALVEFSGPVADAKFPAKGGILLKKQDNTWYVRQVLFYDKIPGLFNLPDKSVTVEDKQQEPRVKSVAVAYMDAWERGDRKAMRNNWLNWPKLKKDPVKGLYAKITSMSVTTTSWGEPYVKFAVKLTYRFGVLSYSMSAKGGLIMVKEDGDWKVRPDQMIFDF